MAAAHVQHPAAVLLLRQHWRMAQPRARDLGCASHAAPHSLLLLCTMHHRTCCTTRCRSALPRRSSAFLKLQHSCAVLHGRHMDVRQHVGMLCQAPCTKQPVLP